MSSNIMFVDYYIISYHIIPVDESIEWLYYVNNIHHHIITIERMPLCNLTATNDVLWLGISTVVISVDSQMKSRLAEGI